MTNPMIRGPARLDRCGLPRSWTLRTGLTRASPQVQVIESPTRAADALRAVYGRARERTPPGPRRRPGVRTAQPSRDPGAVGDDAVGHLTHGQPQVHGGLLDPAEGVRLAEPEVLLEDRLGPLDRLAGLQALLEVGDLRLQGGDLGEPADRHLDRRREVGLGERLDEVRHRAGVPGPLDQVALRERRQHHHRGDPLGRDPLGGGDAVQDGHLHVQDDQVGPLALGQLDGLLPVGGLPHDVVPLVDQHLREVHADQRLVLGDDDSRPPLRLLAHPVRLSGPPSASPPDGSQLYKVDRHSSMVGSAVLLRYPWPPQPR